MVIKQNQKVARQIIAKQKNVSSVKDILMELTSEEWAEYLLYLLHQNNDPRDSKKNFSFSFKYAFEYERSGGKNEDNGILYSTLYAFRKEITPYQKRAISDAISNLIRNNISNKIFIEILMNSLAHYTDESCLDSDPIGSFYFEDLKLIINSKGTTNASKWSALALLQHLRGVERPSPEVFLQAVLEYQKRFIWKDEFIGIIIHILLKAGFYKECLISLTYLDKKWPITYRFDEDVIQMVSTEYQGAHQPNEANIQFVIDEVIPKLRPAIKKRLVKILKGNCYDETDYWNAKKLTTSKFPANGEDLDLIIAL